jgi:hypothetical protein
VPVVDPIPFLYNMPGLTTLNPVQQGIPFPTVDFSAAVDHWLRATLSVSCAADFYPENNSVRQITLLPASSGR